MAAPRLTPLQWLICAIAALGFAFDIYEVLMAPLVVGPAIGEITGFKPGTPDFAKTGTPPVIIRIYRLRPNVSDKMITPEVFRRLKGDGDAERVGPDLTAKDILGVM